MKVKFKTRSYFRPLNDDDREFLRVLSKGVSEELQKASRKAARMQQEAKQAAQAVLNC